MRLTSNTVLVRAFGGAAAILVGVQLVSCSFGTADVFRQVWIDNRGPDQLFVAEEGRLNRDDPNRVLTIEVKSQPGTTLRVLDASAGAGSFLRIFDSECRLVQRLELTNDVSTVVKIDGAVTVEHVKPTNSDAIPDAPLVRHCVTTEYPVVTDFP